MATQLQQAAAVLDYLRSPYFRPSFSSIAAILDNNLKFYRYILPKIDPSAQKEPSDAMVSGTLLDRHLFEYERALHRDLPRYKPFVGYSGGLNTKEGKAAYAVACADAQALSADMEAAGLEPPLVVKNDLINKIEMQTELLQYATPAVLGGLSLYDLLVTHSTHVQLDLSIQFPENTCFWESPINCARGRIDCYGYNSQTKRYYLADLKKMPDVASDVIGRTVRDRKLSVQLAMYGLGLRQLGFEVQDYYIIAVSDDGESNLYAFSPSEIAAAEKEAAYGIALLDELIKNGEPKTLLESFCEKRNCAVYR